MDTRRRQPDLYSTAPGHLLTRDRFRSVGALNHVRNPITSYNEQKLLYLRNSAAAIIGI